MQQYLTYQLYGAMAAWGEPAVGEMRHSALYPSKSAMIGLIAAALGIKREQESAQLALANSVIFGFKVLHDGSLLRDFHTAQVPKQESKRVFATREQELVHSAKLNTVLSFRDYRCDAYVVVALRVTDPAPYDLGTIQAALLKPQFSLYLGRKSCPLALPLQPKLVKASGVAAALNDYDSEIFSGIPATNRWRGFGKTAKSFGPKPYYVWEGDGFDITPTFVNSRYDMPSSRQRWQFTKRLENRAEVQHQIGESACISLE